MRRARAAAPAAALAAGLWGCASIPPRAAEPKLAPAETAEGPADAPFTGAVYLVTVKSANLPVKRCRVTGFTYVYARTF